MLTYKKHGKSKKIILAFWVCFPALRTQFWGKKNLLLSPKELYA